MKLRTRTYNIRVRLGDIVLATVMVCWAGYYFFSTKQIPEIGLDSVLFIKPLFFGLLICYPFVVFKALTITKINSGKKDDKDAPKERFMSPKQIVLILILFTYAVATAYVGYLVSTAVFIIVTGWFLGTRNILGLSTVSIGLSIALSYVFKTILEIPINIWPL